jgi:hypothetical protein
MAANPHEPTSRKNNVTKSKLIAAALLAACSIASAQDVVLLGHVQRVILQPSGAENCPPTCPAVATAGADGTREVCISNAGGCQTMEVAVDSVYRGEAIGRIRQFKTRIGEWGPSFPVTEKQIVVSEHAGNVFWSLATVRDGRIYVDPKRLRSVSGVPILAAGDGDLMALDEVLARSARR